MTARVSNVLDATAQTVWECVDHRVIVGSGSATRAVFRIIASNTTGVAISMVFLTIIAGKSSSNCSMVGAALTSRAVTHIRARRSCPVTSSYVWARATTI